MTGPFTVTGTLTDEKTIVLDQAVTGARGRVRLVLEPLEPIASRASLREFLDDLRKRQAASGHVPRTRDEIDRALREERAAWAPKSN
jgi:hypothetical protein